MHRKAMTHLRVWMSAKIVDMYFAISRRQGFVSILPNVWQIARKMHDAACLVCGLTAVVPQAKILVWLSCFSQRNGNGQSDFSSIAAHACPLFAHSSVFPPLLLTSPYLFSVILAIIVYVLLYICKLALKSSKKYTPWYLSICTMCIFQNTAATFFTNPLFFEQPGPFGIKITFCYTQTFYFLTLYQTLPS